MIDAKLLAARAFLKASYESRSGPVRAAYRTMGQRALQMQLARGSSSQLTLERIEADFQQELAEADKWYAVLRTKELTWIRDGRDPEAEFDRLYTADPESADTEGDAGNSPVEGWKRVAIVAGAAAAFVVAASACFAIPRVRRRRRVRLDRTTEED
jgi:hypothetical protein